MVFAWKVTGAQKVKCGHGSWDKNVTLSIGAQKVPYRRLLAVLDTTSQTHYSQTVTIALQAMLALIQLAPPLTEI
jgi:hypothetical protein